MTFNSTRYSFFPSTIRSWNELDPGTRQIQSPSQFKTLLNSNRDLSSLPKYLLLGDRKLNIIHTRIRCFSSSLNSDLYRVKLTPSPNCRCGNFNEDAFHYFFECRLYQPQRTKLLNILSNFWPLTLQKLLFGDLALADDANAKIINATLVYIKDSKRFIS